MQPFNLGQLYQSVKSKVLARPLRIVPTTDIPKYRSSLRTGVRVRDQVLGFRSGPTTHIARDADQVPKQDPLNTPIHGAAFRLPSPTQVAARLRSRRHAVGEATT